jgi:hypothetical protein
MPLVPYTNASSKSPYESGYDHGCDDADILDPDDRYINQPEKGPNFHTDEFMSGYNDGYDECSNGGDSDGSESSNGDNEDNRRSTSNNDNFIIEVIFVDGYPDRIGATHVYIQDYPHYGFRTDLRDIFDIHSDNPKSSYTFEIAVPKGLIDERQQFYICMEMTDVDLATACYPGENGPEEPERIEIIV